MFLDTSYWASSIRAFPPVGLILEQVQVTGLVMVHLDDPGHGGIVQEIRLGPGRLQEFQLAAGHRDALADVAGEPAEFADRIPVLLPPRDMWSPRRQ
jgi:hypothetical protein